jgi:CheY-like chemotaxis protein
MSNDAKTVVLIADDEPSTLALLGRHLRSRGYSVLEAADGDEAWELAHEHLPDLVILDVMMPGMSGWEVCRKVREAVSLAHTGVIMLTGIGETLNEMTSPLYGADAHVDKPFEFATLDTKIGEVLERRRAGALGRPDANDDEDQRITLTEVVKPIAKAKPATPKPKAAPAPKKAPAKAKAAPKKAPPKKAPPKKAPPKKAPPKKAAKKAQPAPKKTAPAPKAKKKAKTGAAKQPPKVTKKASKAKPMPPKSKAAKKTPPVKAAKPKAAKPKAAKPKPAKKRR